MTPLPGLWLMSLLLLRDGFLGAGLALFQHSRRRGFAIRRGARAPAGHRKNTSVESCACLFGFRLHAVCAPPLARLPRAQLVICTTW